MNLELKQAEEVNEDQYRLAIAFITNREIVNILNWMNVPDGDCLQICGNGVPEDAVVANVTHAYHHNAWAITLRHKSFEVVPEGQELPILNRYERQCVILVRKSTLRYNQFGEALCSTEPVVFTEPMAVEIRNNWE